MSNFPAHYETKTCSRHPNHVWVGNRMLCPHCRSGEEIRVTPGVKPEKKPKKRRGNYTPWRESVVP